MIITHQSAICRTHYNEYKICAQIESAARTCYQSESKRTEGGAIDFVRKLIERGHESMLEHAYLTWDIITDRATANEIVRHRLSSYAQESQRYCRYTDGVVFIAPNYATKCSYFWHTWQMSCETAEKAYLDLLRAGYAPQEARAVLPNSTKTEIVMTANMREWRHFLRLRTDKAAHPMMQELALKILEQLRAKAPVFVEDIHHD